MEISKQDQCAVSSDKESKDRFKVCLFASMSRLFSTNRKNTDKIRSVSAINGPRPEASQYFQNQLANWNHFSGEGRLATRRELKNNNALKKNNQKVATRAALSKLVNIRKNHTANS